MAIGVDVIFQLRRFMLKDADADARRRTAISYMSVLSRMRRKQNTHAISL
jgi:hypothetical protein